MLIPYFTLQITVRLILAAVVTIAWTKLKRVITKLYGSNVSFWFSLITLTQFHFIFYMSRTLPNTMALPIGNFTKKKICFSLFHLFFFLQIFSFIRFGLLVKWPTKTFYYMLRHIYIGFSFGINYIFRSTITIWFKIS